MTETTTAPTFTTEELFDYARRNATGFSLALLDYANEHGHGPESAAEWVGRRFAPGWDDLTDKSVSGVARAIALNIASTGGEVTSVGGDDQHAEIVYSQWPSDGTLSFST